jgi:hypothetical protein
MSPENSSLRDVQLQRISSKMLIGTISAELEIVVKCCVEREASAGTVANEGTSAKTLEMTAKRSCTMVKAGKAR